MHDEVTEFARVCRLLSTERRLCIGEPMDISALDSWPRQVGGPDEFRTLVSTAYVLWRETWKLDVRFILSLRRADADARRFDDLVYQLRTAHEHADNAGAVQRRADWLTKAGDGGPPASADDWLRCGRSFNSEITVAVDCLRKIAVEVRRRPALARHWQAKAEQSPESAVTRVAADLGVRLSPGSRMHHKLQVDRWWSRHTLRPGQTPAEVLYSYAECSLMTQMDPLPIPYYDILDVLDLIGSPDAMPALRLAHAVAEISGRRGEPFRRLVQATWRELRSDDG